MRLGCGIQQGSMPAAIERDTGEAVKAHCIGTERDHEVEITSEEPGPLACIISALVVEVVIGTPQCRGVEDGAKLGGRRAPVKNERRIGRNEALRLRGRGLR